MKLRCFVCTVSPFNCQRNEVANASINLHFAGVPRFYFNILCALGFATNKTTKPNSFEQNVYAMNKNAA